MAGSDLEKIVWLEMEYLRSELRENNKRKMSAAKIAARLNEIGGNEPGWQMLNEHRMHEIRAVESRMRSEQWHQLLTAIRKLRDGSDIQPLSEAGLEGLFASALPNEFSEAATPFEGEELGEDADLICGAWQCFYHAPAGRKKRRPEIRGLAVVLERARPSSRFVDGVVFSENNRWRGRAFINRKSLYLMMSNINQAEAAFFITNRPSREHPKIVGVGVNLDRDTGQGGRPALGAAVFFGTKCASEQSIQKELAVFLEEVAFRKNLDPAVEEKIRTTFCRAFRDLDALQEDFPALSEYIRSLWINQKAGETAQWLRVVWK
jgi:hypothetical protein